MRCYLIFITALILLPVAVAPDPVKFLLSEGYQISEWAGEVTYEGIEVLRPLSELSPIAPPTHSLVHPNATADRHGRWQVQLVDDNGHWVQEEWLRTGTAILMHSDMPEAVLGRLRVAEGEARTKRLGVWVFGSASVFNCHEFARTERYQVVQGRVQEVGFAASNAFLNFGEDYRTDFTARIERADFARFGGKAALEALQGERVEVRGWAYFRGGVMIDLFWPADFAILGDDEPIRREVCFQ